MIWSPCLSFPQTQIQLKWPGIAAPNSPCSQCEPTSHDPSGLRQGSKALAWSNTEVRDSQTSRQIWQIWWAENTRRILCACSENRVRLELARALDPCRRPKGSWALGTKMSVNGKCFINSFSERDLRFQIPRLSVDALEKKAGESWKAHFTVPCSRTSSSLRTGFITRYRSNESNLI